MKKNICIIYPNRSSSSETFIQEHLNNLPCNVFKLYGGWFPAYTENDIPLKDYGDKIGRNYIKKLREKFGFGNHDKEDSSQQECLFNFLKFHKIDAVLAEYGLTGVAVMNVCEEANIPLIVHFHGFDAYSKKVLEENKIQYQVLFKKASRIIAVSNHMLQHLKNIGAPVQKIIVNACGVNINKFSPALEKVEAPFFLFTGRFVNKKAPHLVIICFSRVLAEIPGARLIMIGDGGLGSTQELYYGCKQLARGLNIEYAIEFKGSISNEDIADQMKKSLVFIQHSVTTDTGDSEGTPVSMLEACASGLAVIGTNHGGIKDVIIHDETGFLVEEYDLENTVAYMIRLAKNIPLAHELGLKASQRIAEHYSLSKSISTLWKSIEESMIKENNKASKN